MLRVLVVGNGEHSQAYAEVLEDIKGKTPDVVTVKEVTCNQDIQDAAEIIKDANGAFTLSTPYSNASITVFPVTRIFSCGVFSFKRLFFEPCVGAK